MSFERRQVTAGVSARADSSATLAAKGNFLVG